MYSFKQELSMGINVDMDSHNGLRGALSVYIVLFHLCFRNEQHPFINFQGSSLMPLFFMLSAFSLVVGYGRKKYVLQTKICGLILSSADSENDCCEKFDHWKFYQNRLARVMPLYYLDSLGLGLPLLFTGYSMIDWKLYPSVLFINIIPLTTLIFNYAILDGPAWTICTLLYMWLVFPMMLPRVQRMTDEELVKGISKCYWLQLLLMIVLTGALFPFLSYIKLTRMNLFYVATTHPIIRFPVFLMGMYAGELCLRYSEGKLPWPSAYFRFFPGCSMDTATLHPLINRDEDTNEDTALIEGACVDTSIWKERVTRQTITLLSLTCLVSLLDTISLLFIFKNEIFGEYWFQGIVPFAQLELIVALTRDGRATRISKWFRTSVGNWLGDRSMAIYLVHWPLIGYLCFMIHGKPLPFPRHYVGKCDEYDKHSDEWKHCTDVEKKWFLNNMIPLWGIPVILVWTLILADLTYRLVEVPCRKLFRSS